MNCQFVRIDYEQELWQSACQYLKLTAYFCPVVHAVFTDKSDAISR